MTVEKLEHLERIRKRYTEREAKQRMLYLDSNENKTGAQSNFWMDHLHTLAVANFILKNDIQGFKSKLVEVVRLKVELFERYEKGESVSRSFISLLAYQQLYDALASGDMELVGRFARMLLGREEMGEIHIFDRIMGISLRSLILNDEKMFLEWNAKQFERCYEKDKSFAGYPKVMKGIFQKDEAKVNEGLKDLLKGHRKLIVGAGVFNNTDQKWLCVWGLGLANLAISRGIRVDIDDEYLPRDLLIKL